MGKLLNDQERNLFIKLYDIDAQCIIISKHNKSYYISIDGSKFFRLSKYIGQLFMIDLWLDDKVILEEV